jgi:hypothetical protein
MEKWRPLLDDDLAERSWQAIRAIAREIEPPAPAVGRPTPDRWGLAGGSAGTALFYAYLAEATGEEDFADRALFDLENALAGAATQPFGIGLWQGLLGVTWTFDHLAQRLFATDDAGDADAEGGDPGDADALLLDRLREEEESFDLIQGLAGYGIACLEGLPRPGARQGLDLVLDQLLGKAERLAPGYGWFTPPEQLPPWQAELAPDGYWNLGLAHGIPAVAALLARCIAAGVRGPELEPWLAGTVEWMLAQRGDHGFPSWVAKGPRPPQKAARLAWCYGDPGVAASLLVAGRAVGRRDWTELAAEIACRGAAARDLELAGIKDAGVCHGAAGLAHIYNRLWQASGREELAEASRFWFGQVLEMRRHDDGIGGFKSWSIPRGRGSVELGWQDDPGLLTGSAGIGLCLLAAVTGLEPEWDRSLVLSGKRAEAQAGPAPS